MKLGVAVDFHLVVQAERPQEEEERGLLVDRFLAKPGDEVAVLDRGAFHQCILEGGLGLVKGIARTDVAHIPSPKSPQAAGAMPAAAARRVAKDHTWRGRAAPLVGTRRQCCGQDEQREIGLSHLPVRGIGYPIVCRICRHGRSCRLSEVEVRSSNLSVQRLKSVRRPEFHGFRPRHAKPIASTECQRRWEHVPARRHHTFRCPI